MRKKGTVKDWLDCVANWQNDIEQQFDVQNAIELVRECPVDEIAKLFEQGKRPCPKT